MSSILKVNTLTGVSTAGSIAVTAEGNSTTTNLQQGLTKAWVDIDAPTTSSGAAISLVDSFNIDSMTDNGTGQIMMVITNDMATVNYVVHISSGETATYGAVDSGTQTASQVRVETRNDAGSVVNAVTYVSLLGDLA